MLLFVTCTLLSQTSSSVYGFPQIVSFEKVRSPFLFSSITSLPSYCPCHQCVPQLYASHLSSCNNTSALFTQLFVYITFIECTICLHHLYLQDYLFTSSNFTGLFIYYIFVYRTICLHPLH